MSSLDTFAPKALGKSQPDARGPGRSSADVALATPIYSSARVVEGIGYPIYMRGGVAMFGSRARVQEACTLDRLNCLLEY
jgi:hypothetical protein